MMKLMILIENVHHPARYNETESGVYRQGGANPLNISYLERIKDLSTNIAEDVVFMVDGDLIRHQVEKLDRRHCSNRSFLLW